MSDIAKIQKVMALVRTLKRPKTFFLDTVFPFVTTEESKEVHIDIEIGHRKSAPFVAHDAQAKPIRLDGYKTRTFTPPSVKLLVDLNPEASLTRLAGERIGGEMTAQNRDAIIRVNAVDKIYQTVTRRWEQMATSALVDGKLDIAGEGYEGVITIDFGRDASLDVTLTGGARWTQDTATPLQDIEDMSEQVNALEGATITDIVMDLVAWRLLREDPKLQKAIDLRRNTGGNTADIGPGNYVKGVKLVADLGDYRFWVYSEFKDEIVINEDGTFDVVQNQPLLAPGTVVGIGPDIEGTRLFGAILDKHAIKSGNTVNELFLKEFEENNPGRDFIMGLSSPLMVPKRPNASWTLRVAAPDPVEPEPDPEG